MASFSTNYFLPLGLDLITRRAISSTQGISRTLRWSYSSVSAPFSLAEPHDDPSLRALYEPYPSAPPHHSIFEPEDSSYQHSSSSKAHILQKHRSLSQQGITLSTQFPHTTRSNALLIQHVTQGDFAGAISLRRDLDALHTTITPNFVYAIVAQHLLDHPDRSNPYAFLDWCELVPNIGKPWAKATKIPDTMLAIFTQLLRAPESIDLLCRFAVLATRKGMAKSVAIPAISHTARYSSPEVASKLLSDLTIATTKSDSQLCTSTVPPKVMRSWNSTFVRTLCLSGRIDAAHQSILALHSNGCTVAPSAYRIVSEELEAIGRLDEATHLRELCNNAGFARPHFPFRSPIIYKSTPMPWGPLSRQLRWIKLRIGLGLGISTANLSTFMKAYLSTGHYRALPLLRRRIIRKCNDVRWKHSLGLWGTAEMQLYRGEGKHDEVLRVFQSMFLPVGITDELLHELGVLQISTASSSHEHPRLWPPSEALTLASWSAAFLAASREDREALGRCYSIFLKACSPASDTLFQLPPAMKPDAAAFQPWIGAFARKLGPEGVIRVMGHMRDLEIPPSIMTWNALAKAYVTNNEWDIAKSILTRMEGSRGHITLDAASSVKLRLRNRLGPLTDWGFPAANLSTYYTLLRELYMTKQISAGRELIDMLMRSGYQSNDRRIQPFLQAIKRGNGISAA